MPRKPNLADAYLAELIVVSPYLGLAAPRGLAHDAARAAHGIAYANAVTSRASTETDGCIALNADQVARFFVGDAAPATYIPELAA
jgi:hypothetical protein